MRKGNFKYILLLIGFILSFTVNAQDISTSDKDKEAMDVFLDAEKSKMLTNYPEAIRLYKKTLSIDDEYDPAMFQLAHLYILEQRYEEALYWAEKAYQLDQKNTWYAFLLIDLYRNSYQIGKAIVVYNTLLEENPANTEYLFNLSNLYLAVEDTDNAIKCLNKIEELEGVSEKTALQKKAIFLQENDFDSAIETMKALHEVFPQKESYCSMIAELYMQNNQADEAILWYKKVLEINPNDPYIQITLADYYSKQDDLESAYKYLKEGYANPHLDIDTKIRVLMGYFEAGTSNTMMKSRTYELTEILVKTHPDEAKSHAIYGDLLFNDSLYSKASSEFEKVVAIDSSRYAVWEQLLYSLSMENRYEEMANYSERAIALFPAMDFPYYINAIANFQLGHTKKVISVLETAVYFASNNDILEQYYMFLGDAYHEEGQVEKAYESYEKCLNINPNNSFVLNNYAYYLTLEKKQLPKAKEMAALAVKTAPNPNNLDTYGWVLYELGDYQEAQKYIQQAIDTDTTGSAVTLEHLGDVYFKLGETKNARKYWKKAKKMGGDSESLMQKIKTGLYEE